MEYICRQDPKIFPEPDIPEAPSDRPAFLHCSGPDVHPPQFGRNTARVEAQENGGGMLRSGVRKIGRVGDVFERLEKVEVLLRERDARQGDRMLVRAMCLTMFIR